jgi:hypothetical protein
MEKLTLLQNAATECREYLRRMQLEGHLICRIDTLLAQCGPELPGDLQLGHKIQQVEDDISYLSLITSDVSSGLLKYVPSLLGQVSPQHFISTLQFVVSVNDRPLKLQGTGKKLISGHILREDLLHDNLFHAHSLFRLLKGQFDPSASQTADQTWLRLLAAIALCRSGDFEPGFLFTTVDRLLDSLRTALGISQSPIANKLTFSGCPSNPYLDVDGPASHCRPLLAELALFLRGSVINAAALGLPPASTTQDLRLYTFRRMLEWDDSCTFCKGKLELPSQASRRMLSIGVKDIRQGNPIVRMAVSKNRGDVYDCFVEFARKKPFVQISQPFFFYFACLCHPWCKAKRGKFVLSI